MTGALDGTAPQETFSRRGMLLLASVGAAALLGLAALVAYAPELRSGADGGGHALSRSAIGYAGLVRLLRDEGMPTLVSRGRFSNPRRGGGLLVLTPPLRGSPAEVDKAITHAALLVLPKWRGLAMAAHPGWVYKAALASPGEVLQPLSRRSLTLQRREGRSRPSLTPIDGSLPAAGRFSAGEIDSFQTLRPVKGLRPMIVDERGGVLLGALQGQPELAVLSDPDLMNTAGLASLERARTSSAIIDRLRGEQGPVVFDVTLNGFKRTRSLLRLALEPPFLAATVCALAAALLMVAHGLARFGPPQRRGRAFVLGKRALADNAAALIRLARREPRMAPRYAVLTRRALALALGLPRDLAPERIEAALDKLTPPGAQPFSALVARAQDTRDEARLMAATRALHQRREEWTREHR